MDDLSLLPALVAAGVDCFQVRDKTLDGAGLVALTRAALATGATVVVNDRVDVALVAGAHGVHVGATDIAVADVLRIAPDLLVGATCRTGADVVAAAAAGADYAGVGPVFVSSSKAGLPEPLGPDGLGGVVGSGLPVVAIGGITPRNVGPVADVGAHGVAVIGGIWREPDPVAAVRALAEALGR
ncbi:thiamine phosphate synthase [Nocardioides maradonensis]